VSAFGAGGDRALIRWEWVDAIVVERGSVVVRSSDSEIELPSGCFGLPPEELAEQLEQARAIQNRPDVIRRLSAGGDGGGDG
jgi:hypothetical protein